MYGVLTARLAHDAYRLAIGITSKATGIVNQRAHTFGRFHFVVHGALYLTGDIYQAVVSTYYDDIVVTQADITAELTIQDIVIYVDSANQTVVAINLDVTQCTDIVRTASHIQSMEYRCKCCQRIGTWCLDFTHDVNRDGASLTYRQANLTAAIACTQL